MTRDTSVSYHVTGIREVARAFKQIDVTLSKDLRARFLDVAKLIVGRVQQRMPWQSGEAARSVKAVAGAAYAGISRPGGGTPWQGVKADYYPWLDFGGHVGRGHSVYRPVIAGGRFLYPAIAESTTEIVDAADAALVASAKRAGFDVREGI